MKNIKLENSKKRLTIMFVGIIFSIAFFLGFLFITWKYIHDTWKEKDDFNSFYNLIYSRINFENVDTLIASFEKEPILVDNKKIRITDRRKALIKEKLSNIFPWNIIILKNNELIYYKLTQKVSEDVIEQLLTSKFNSVFINDWIIANKIEKFDYSIYLFQKYNSNVSNYIFDLSSYLLIILLFSVWFYYIWLSFIWNVLKPVEDNMKDMQDFIHNAWHELKTPISVISSNLQLIKATKELDLDLISEWITEINRLNHLIESLVELSNINIIENTDKIDISSEIETIIKDFKVDSENKKIEINFNKSFNKYLTINKQYFYILFSNILWNAIKYSNKWWKIDVKLSKKELIIKDNWIWIKQENIEKIWDRFYTCSEWREVDSSWIWLSLVKKIADIYKFKLEVKSEVWKGSEFVIKF